MLYNFYHVACDVTLSVYPHRASLKNMPDHGGNRTYDLWILRPVISSTVMILVHFHIIGLNTPFRKVLGVDY